MTLPPLPTTPLASPVPAVTAGRAAAPLNGAPPTASGKALPTRIKTDNAFNLTQAFRNLFKAPGDVLYGLSKYYNNLASTQFAGNPWQNPDTWYNRILNVVVPDHLEPPRNLETHAPQELQTDGAMLNMVNGITKIVIYGGMFFVNRANQKKNLAETEDPVHRRLMTLKNRGDMGENLGMCSEKLTYLPVLYLVKNGYFAEAAALRAIGLVTSGLAWCSSFVSGAAMAADETHSFRKARAEAKTNGSKTPLRDAWKKVNVTNLQNSVSRVTGALVRVPTQSIALSTGALIYARSFAPAFYDTAMTGVASVSPQGAAALQGLLPSPDKVDAHLIFSWLNGAYAVPQDWITAFAVISMIGPAVSLVPNVGNMFSGARGYLTALRHADNESASQLKAVSADVMKQASLGIASNSFYLASAYLMASPESEAHGVLLSVFGSAFMTAQYFRAERKSLAAIKERLVAKFKHARLGWKLKAQIKAAEIPEPHPDRADLLPIERSV